MGRPPKPSLSRVAKSSATATTVSLNNLSTSQHHALCDRFLSNAVPGELFPRRYALWPRRQSRKKALLDCFHGFTAANGMAAFSGFLQEGQYYIDLWAAHLLVEHYHPDEPIWRLCMETIETYANSTIDPKVAQEELEWLRRRVQA